MRLKSALLALALLAAPLQAYGQSCPTTLPPSVNFTGSAVDEAHFKTAITQMRNYLNCLLASSGQPTDAKVSLGLAAVATSGSFTDLLNVPSQVSPIPIGAIFPFAGLSPPAGYLFAAGQQVSRTTFAGLFSVVGTTFGGGDGFSTFNLPDLRGRVPAGVDAMNGIAASRLGFGAAGGIVSPATLGASAGEQWHIQTQAEMVQHAHSAFSSSTPFLTASIGASGGGGVITTNLSTSPGDVGAAHASNDSNGAPAVWLPGSISGGGGSGAVTGSISTSTSIGASGSSSPMNITQPTLVINYIIKN